MSLQQRLAEATLIVAHPDDEILWFSSVYTAVRRVLVCFLETPGDDSCTAARRELVSRFPHGHVTFLGLVESMAFGQADWADPQRAPSGLALPGGTGVQPLPGFSAKRYRDNHAELLLRLRPLLAGSPVVLTHNPWGEYGHEEHVQVYRAVTDLRRELGFDVWFDTYASDRTAALMARTVARTRFVHESLPTCPEAVAPIEALYRETGCWTWPFEDYRWFESETFAFDPLEPGPHKAPGSRLPINYISVDAARWQRPPLSLGKRVLRKLRKLRKLRELQELRQDG